MSDYRLRRVRSMEVLSRPDYNLRAPDPITRVVSMRDLTTIAALRDPVNDYMFRRPYLYSTYCPPSTFFRRYYPTEGLLTDPYPTYPRNYSYTYDYYPPYPSTYSPYYGYAPISYRRLWTSSYGQGSGFLTGRYYHLYGGRRHWERAYTRSYYRPPFYATDYLCHWY